MEYVDIINEKKQIIGSVSKQEAHEKGLLHRTVIAEVINSKGEWTLIKQSAQKQDAGQYVNPIGGHVTAGETELEALKREAWEEYGLKDLPDEKIKLVGKHIYYREVKGKKENHLFVVYEISSDEEPILNEESDEFVRITPTHLAKQLKEQPEKFGDAFHFVISTFFPNLKY